ncbi:hypothetical protein PF002_g11581 [Phytophthora fragariae]|uniref:Uncharacterized protein n=1 Tax=Phytophthora fragariae TaxID=53985 RepID=A0A6A3ZHI0_9STRA|nr:hypothetical protein PF002_g11581 [Phytophthora fragariae]
MVELLFSGPKLRSRFGIKTLPVRTNTGGYSYWRSSDRSAEPRPHGVLDVAKLFKNFDWRNVANTNNMIISRNLHIPHYYSSFWSFVATLAVADPS